MCLICLAGSGGLVSGSKEPECEPQPSAKSNHIADASCGNIGREFRSTETFDNSAHNISPQTELDLNLSVAASPARTSVLLAMEQASKGNAADYGKSSHASLASYDPNTSSWKTSQLCLDGDLAEFSEIWPQAGTMRSGIASQRDSISDIAESEFGLWPTMCSRDWRSGATPTRTQFMKRVSSRGNDLPAFLRVLIPHKSGKIDPSWGEAYMGYPEGWTELLPSAIRLSRKSRKLSGEQSSPPKDKV